MMVTMVIMIIIIRLIVRIRIFTACPKLSELPAIDWGPLQGRCSASKVRLHIGGLGFYKGSVSCLT